MNDVFQKSAATYEPRGRLDPAGFERHVRFRTYPPPADLAPFIEHFWTIRWDEVAEAYHSEEVMHRPYIDLFLSRPESGIQGTFRGKRVYVASGSGRLVGVRFLPGAFRAFWDGVIGDIQDCVMAAQRVFPQADQRFVEQLLEQDDPTAVANLQELLRTKYPRPDANIAIINAIIVASETDEILSTVAAVATAFGKSERWLQQLFRDYVGIGLKWLLQRQRLLAAASRIRASDQPDWAAIAYEFGYSSQQHFITAFKQVLGKTPLQYKRDLTPR